MDLIQPYDVINQLISAIAQVAFVLLIVFICFIFRRNKDVSFRKYAGLYLPPRGAWAPAVVVSLLFLGVGLLLVFTSSNFRAVVMNPPSVTGMIRLMQPTAAAVITLLAIALVKTSLAEEIFFRGLIAKRLVNSLGPAKGNVVQALIFGVVHLLLFAALTRATFLSLIVIFVFSTLAGLAVGHVKVKLANGSILPGWLSHGLGNAISYSVICFGL